MEVDGSLTCERIMHEIIQAFKSEHSSSSSSGRPEQNPMSVVPNIAMSTCPPEASHLKMDPDAAAVNFSANAHGGPRNGSGSGGGSGELPAQVQIGRTRTDISRPQIHNAFDSPRYTSGAAGAGVRAYATANSNSDLSTHSDGSSPTADAKELAGGGASPAPIDFRLKYDSCDHYELRMVDEDDNSPDMDFPALQVSYSWTLQKRLVCTVCMCSQNGMFCIHESKFLARMYNSCE